MKYIIEGGKGLVGKIKVSGSKNSVFPCIAAALLTDQEVILENVPNIRDTEILIEIIKNLGVKTKFNGNTLKIKAERLKEGLPVQLMKKLRGSIVLVGSILARNRKAAFVFPGGDIIGRRNIDSHLQGFRQLGVIVKQNDLSFDIRFAENSQLNRTIFLIEKSVTATENLVLASVLGKGRVRVKNAAKEPHVVDLCKMLVSMGANIFGIGTDTLIVSGVKKLQAASFRLGVDVLEVGTYAIAAAITKGKITITGVDQTDLDPVLIPLSKFGIEFKKRGSNITCTAKKIKPVQKIVTNAWPGFSTDLMSPVIVLATQASGVTLCHDWMYESRMFFVDKLIAMGANITIADPHRVLVYGPCKLKGRELESPDIRAGMALILAALIANGSSIINKAELIERGYEDVVGKLKELGANIERSGV